ncbi:MAG TPA: heparan-alpha-glucosaminide N-acetyltransferase domain-containing protein, partial [Puia sp.]|nr:heparan-alpha-glucosaminide N-acetyltransferase domain-containing protein [Puia sp.]
MKKRFVTLDVFRGMTVFLMIVVNTQGSGAVPYAAMMHAEWNGCTLTDLVFPSFVFAVGNAMVFTRPGIGKIFRRSILLFVAGWLLTWWLSGAALREVRVMAVLQRIALAYFFAALLVKAIGGPSGQGGVNDRWVLVVSVGLLLSYWALLELLGVRGQAYSVEGNAVRRIDLLVLGPQHMYREKGVAFDP